MRAIQVFTAIAAGILLGWAMSTKSIADDCERLGAFYDGRDIHHCTSAVLNHDATLSQQKSQPQL